MSVIKANGECPLLGAARATAKAGASLLFLPRTPSSVSVLDFLVKDKVTTLSGFRRFRAFVGLSKIPALRAGDNRQNIDPPEGPFFLWWQAGRFLLASVPKCPVPSS